MEIKLQVELEEKRKKALNLQKVSKRGMMLKQFLYYIYLFGVGMGEDKCVHHGICEGQRTVLWRQSSPTIMWVLRTKLGLSGW